jgi:formate dehydrogenase iron-sulfur subunit
MPISRRGFLKLAGVGLGALALPVTTSKAKAAPGGSGSSASMLYDSTKCVGCRACQTACKQRSHLPYETGSQGLYEEPVDLSANTWTLIKLYQGEEGTSFVKNQCMHCNDPACVSVCPVVALEKLESGPVIYHDERCIGCRYCMAACPFGIPKAQWSETMPLIQKCDFCADIQAEGGAPACSEACPTGALIFGKREEMLQTAHARLESDANYAQHVYGETEAGGTAMLYISDINYAALGFPALESSSLPSITWPYMRAVPGVIAVVATLSTAIYLRTHRNALDGSQAVLDPDHTVVDSQTDKKPPERGKEV